MRRLKLWGVGLLAVFALTAVASASASAAAPEFHTFGAKHFTLKGEAVRFTNVDGITYGCSATSGEGEVTGAQTATAKLKFTGCGADGISCRSAEGKSGEIQSLSLPVRLVYLSQTKHEVALVFNYHKSILEGGNQIAKWECGGTEGLGIQGSIVVPLTPVNHRGSSFALPMAQGSRGVQNPTAYENEEGKTVSAFPTMALINTVYEEGSVADALTLTSSEPWEITG